jgi:hypothetical protein
MLKRILVKGLLTMVILLFTISPALSAQDTPNLERVIAQQELLIQSKDVEIAKKSYELQGKDTVIQTKDMIIQQKNDELFWARIQTIAMSVAVIVAVL